MSKKKTTFSLRATPASAIFGSIATGCAIAGLWVPDKANFVKTAFLTAFFFLLLALGNSDVVTTSENIDE